MIILIPDFDPPHPLTLSTGLAGCRRRTRRGPTMLEERFDEVMEAARELGLISEAAQDRLTDSVLEGKASWAALVKEWEARVMSAHALAADQAVAGVARAAPDDEMEAFDDYRLEEELPSMHSLALEDGPAAEDETIGVVIDLHYLQIAASSFSLATAWSVPAFEAALIDACGGGEITMRFACDSTPHGADAAGSPGGGKGRTPPPRQAPGKARLHAALVEAGYTLVLSPNKTITRAQVWLVPMPPRIEHRTCRMQHAQPM